jgi:hypothetical protein
VVTAPDAFGKSEPAKKVSKVAEGDGRVRRALENANQQVIVFAHARTLTEEAGVTQDASSPLPHPVRRRRMRAEL